MNLLHRFYPESRFGGWSDRDGTVAFYGRVQGMLAPGMTVLDVGCGRGAGLADDPVPWRRELRRLRGRCERVIGIDVDPVGLENAGLDEFRHLRDPLVWPVSDASVDLIVSDFVLEHVDDAGSFFSEVSRVLKSDGIFCARTTNRLGYVVGPAKFSPLSRCPPAIVNRTASARFHPRSASSTITTTPTR